MQRGFRIVEMQMDGRFEPLRGDLAEMKITMNACSEAEHIGDIERLDRTVKERARRVVTHLPYNKLPGRMVIELVHLCAFWLNVFPLVLKTIHPTMSPRAILTGLEVDFSTDGNTLSQNSQRYTSSITIRPGNFL